MTAKNVKTQNLRGNAIQVPRGDRIYYTVVNVILALFTLVVLLPLLNVLASSFSSPEAVSFGYVLFWPVDFSVRGYEAVFEYSGLWLSYANTVFYAVVGTCVNLAITMVCAYPLARTSLPGRGVATALFMFTMLFSGGTIPNYLVVKDLGMIDTRAAMILPGALSVYNMIIARTFIHNIPAELEEAAKIDGCSDFKYFFKMVLPPLAHGDGGSLALLRRRPLERLFHCLSVPDGSRQNAPADLPARHSDQEFVLRRYGGFQRGRAAQQPIAARFAEIRHDRRFVRADFDPVSLCEKALYEGRYDRRDQGLILRVGKPARQ